MKKRTKIFFIFYLLVSLSSCTKQTIHQSPCNGDCDGNYQIIYQGVPILPNNGYYEIDWNGLNYFQIEGSLTQLNPQYVTNGVPLIETKFDSDYWVVFDTLRFQTPMYSYLGWFNDNTLNTPINFGSYVYTINDLIDLHPPTNIAGYQIPKHFCVTCPYAETLIGSYSKYNYKPKQNFLVDDEMIGDTINVFIETIFNTEGGIVYHGQNTPSPKEVISDHIKIIII